jgi:hypothetical protein
MLGVHDVGSLFTSIEAILIERAKHPVLLLEAGEERANVSVRSDAGAGTLQGTTICRHVSPLFLRLHAKPVDQPSGTVGQRLRSRPDAQSRPEECSLRHSWSRQAQPPPKI